MADFVDQLGEERTDPTQTLQSGATATGNGTVMQVRAMEGVLLHVIGITTATLIIQGTDANGNTSTLTVKDLNTGASASSITTNGFYVVAFEGLSTINAIIQTYSSGTITVTGAPATVALLGGSSGNNASTVADGANTVEGVTTDAAVTTDANGTISGKFRGLVKIFADLWDSSNHQLKTTLNSLIAGENLVTNKLETEENYLVTQISASTVVKTVANSNLARLGGIFVSAASATPTIAVYDDTTTSSPGNKRIDTFTPVAGTMYRLPAHKYSNGLVIIISGTVSCSVFYN